MSKRDDYLQLHFIVLLAGCIPLVSKVVSIPAVELIALRSLIALPFVWLLCHWRERTLLRMPLYRKAALVSSGFVTAAYWILLAYSAQISRPSVTLVGVATIPIFVTLLRPLIAQKSVKFTEVMTGLNAVFGFFMIFNSGFEYELGLLTAIVAAFFGALLTALQARLVERHHHMAVTYYQMVGVLLGATATQFVRWQAGYGQLWQAPLVIDWALIGLLSLLVSVYAYSAIIKIMRSLSPFTVALTNNLGPIYGIFASLAYYGARGEAASEVLDLYFYAGAFIIVASIFA